MPRENSNPDAVEIRNPVKFSIVSKGTYGIRSQVSFKIAFVPLIILEITKMTVDIHPRVQSLRLL